MAAVCSICGKGTVSGNTLSHSHIRSKRVWKPNLRTVHIIVDGRPVTAKVCTRCLRSGKVQRA